MSACRAENMINARYHYLFRLTLAECMENKRRYIPAIEKALVALCNQNSWSIPAHDRNLNNYHGTDYYVDLVVATAGNGIAQCVAMLDDVCTGSKGPRAVCFPRESISSCIPLPGRDKAFLVVYGYK